MTRLFMCLLVVPFLAATTARASANMINGRVLDWATYEALQLVKVTLLVSGNVFVTTDTDKNGEYAVAKVPAGAFTLEFRKRGYEYHPTIVNGKTSKPDIVIPDTFLLEKNASSDGYYAALAQNTIDRIKKRFSADGVAVQKEHGRVWDQLARMKIAPSGRAAYARTLAEKVPEIVTFDLPKLSDYARANPDAIRRFQSETERALLSATLPPTAAPTAAGKRITELTDRGDLSRQGINDTLTVHVAAYTLEETNASTHAKQEFVATFERSYGIVSENMLYKAVDRDVRHVFPRANVRTLEDHQTKTQGGRMPDRQQTTPPAQR